MKFTDLQLNLNYKEQEVSYNNQTIKVKQYLPAEDRIDLITLAIQQAYADGNYNAARAEVYFYLYLVFYYTDIEFTDEEKTNVFDTYDKLDSNDLIDSIIVAIGKERFNELFEDFQKTVQVYEKYRLSNAYAVDRFVQKVPDALEAVSDMVNNFDPEKYKNVIDFATAANGGRNILTNQPVVTE